MFSWNICIKCSILYYFRSTEVNKVKLVLQMVNYSRNSAWKFGSKIQNHRRIETVMHFAHWDLLFCHTLYRQASTCLSPSFFWCGVCWLTRRLTHPSARRGCTTSHCFSFECSLQPRNLVEFSFLIGHNCAQCVSLLSGV